MVLSIIQSSLDGPIMEAYSCYETTKRVVVHLTKGLWKHLKPQFEVKRVINNLSQEDMDFTQQFEKFIALLAKLEMLRPSTTDPTI